MWLTPPNQTSASSDCSFPTGDSPIKGISDAVLMSLALNVPQRAAISIFPPFFSRALGKIGSRFVALSADKPASVLDGTAARAGKARPGRRGIPQKKRNRWKHDGSIPGVHDRCFLAICRRMRNPLGPPPLRLISARAPEY